MHTTPYGVLLVGLVLCVTPLAEGADSALDRATLRGLTGVRVLVAPLEPEVEREGLTKRQLQTDVERRLQKAGIGVLTDLEREATPGGPLLSITVATATQAQFPHLYALSIVVACHQNAVLERDLSIGAEKASTWSVSVLDLVDRQQLGTARERVTQLVDRFINAYLAVHPKQERSRH